MIIQLSQVDASTWRRNATALGLATLLLLLSRAQLLRCYQATFGLRACDKAGENMAFLYRSIVVCRTRWVGPDLRYHGFCAENQQHRRVPATRQSTKTITHLA
jgi:hypothetical protein